MRGHYIVFEGIDGSGKTTICSNTAARLRESGYKVLLISEPSKSEIGQLLRKQMKTMTLNQKSIALLYAADSYDIQAQILEDYDFILSDRNFFSTVAYQMVDVDENWLFSIHKFLEIPDAVFYLNISVDEALSRIERRDGNREVFENKESLEQIKRNYDKIMNRRNDFKIYKIDTSECNVIKVGEIVLETLKTQFNM